MADWKTYFTEYALNRGWELFESGCCEDFQASASGILATVSDLPETEETEALEKYRVRIPLEQSGLITEALCSCEKAGEGLACEHIACVLWTAVRKKIKVESKALSLQIRQNIPVTALLALSDAQEKEREKRKLLEDEGDLSAYNPGEYRYFHPENYLRGCMVAREDQHLGEKILREQSCGPISVSFGYMDGHDELGYCGNARLVSGKMNYFGVPTWSASVLFSQNRLESVRCQSMSMCSTGKVAGGRIALCPHTYAAVKLLVAYLKENPVSADLTSREGMQVLNSFGGMRLEEVEGEEVLIEKNLRLEPSLNFRSDGSLVVSFWCGKERTYKIKNISEVMKAFRNREEYTFGRDTRLLLAPENLTEASLAWYHFLEDVIADNAAMNQKIREILHAGNGRRYELPEVVMEIRLEGQLLDHFYETAEGKSVKAAFQHRNMSGKQEMHFAERELTPALEIRKFVDPDTGIFEGITLEGELPRFVKGRAAIYYVDGDCLCRLSRERSKALKPLLEQEKGGHIVIRIGRNHLSSFYRNTLPKLRQVASVTEYDTEELARFIPPKPEFVCYFDVEAGYVLVRADACYGPNVYFLTDLLEEDRGGPRIQPFRDRDAEREVLDLIGQYISGYDENEKVFYELKDDEGIFALLDHGLSELMRVSDVQMTERFRRLKLKRKVNVDLGVSVDAGIMDLEIKSEDLSEEELLEILFSYHRKRKFVRLKNGDFLKLEGNETLDSLIRMMEELHLSEKDFVKGKMHLPVYRALYLDRMLEKTKDIYAKRDQHYKQLVSEFRSVEDAEFAIPSSMEPVLRHYQRTGYRWLRTLDHYGFGGILADEMGLGKTLQVIAVLLAVKEETFADQLPVPAKEVLRAKSFGPALIVCPASLVYNWGAELERFAPALRTGLVAGNQSERKETIASWLNYDVLVTSYDLLKRDIDAYDGKRFRFCIIDEAQFIKNSDTAAAKSVKVIRAETRFALTGTPIENRLSELWSIFDFLMPGFLYDRVTFQSELEYPIVKDGDEETIQRLGRMVSPFILRRKKMDVLTDLPEKLEEVRYARMDEKQQKLYDGQVVRMRKKLAEQSEEDFRRGKIEILAELSKIRQICCDPSLTFDDYSGTSAKTESCLELIESLHEGEHKVLVFSQYTKMLEILEKGLEDRGITFYKIIGDTPKKKRIELVNSFNQDDTPVFLISLRAGGTGLNLTGADAVIHYDPWWNLAVQNQATDRAHRIGQTKVVTVYKLIVSGTIEEKIVGMQEMKKKLADDILETEGIGSDAISREDLMNLLDE